MWVICVYDFLLLLFGACVEAITDAQIHQQLNLDQPPQTVKCQVAKARFFLSIRPKPSTCLHFSHKIYGKFLLFRDICGNKLYL